MGGPEARLNDDTDIWVAAGVLAGSYDTSSSPSETENPHPIVESNLVQGRVVKTVRTQLCNQIGKAARILDRCWNGCSIEIRSDRHSVYTDPIDQIAKVAHKHVRWRVGIVVGIGSHVIHRKVDAHDPIRVTDGVELSIGQVSARRNAWLPTAHCSNARRPRSLSR
jgi:hypothetical protein